MIINQCEDAYLVTESTRRTTPKDLAGALKHLISHHLKGSGGARRRGRPPPLSVSRGRPSIVYLVSPRLVLSTALPTVEDSNGRWSGAGPVWNKARGAMILKLETVSRHLNERWFVAQY
ncbi:hypothetical protein J6590_005833 [Homalodisca vitripennis]|nr:hypothetical protein J6590_005833 [Homalodisca vitripennis]